MGGRRFAKGFGWGVVATIVMSAIMIVGTLTGISPMPNPIPAAIVGKLTGGALPQPATMAIAAVLHLGYGGFWGGVLAAVSGRVTVGRGLALGAGLWLIMQVAVLPFLGWGLFGTAQTPRIAVSTLVLREVGGVHFVNVGSVGRPKDGDPRACYAELDFTEDGFDVEFVRVPYDLTRASRDIEQSGLPREFAEFLVAGGKMQGREDASD